MKQVRQTNFRTTFVTAILAVAIMNGCSTPKLKTAEAVKNDFKAILYESSKEWSSVVWEDCNVEINIYNIKAMYRLNGDDCFFEIASGFGVNNFHISAKAIPSTKYPEGEILGVWEFRNGTDLIDKLVGLKTTSGLLSRAAEDLAISLTKSIPLPKK